LSLSTNTDILRMVIGRLRMRIAHGTTTFLCEVKSHMGDPLNETVDDLTDLGHTFDSEHTRSTGR
jgi:hypothetical protein